MLSKVNSPGKLTDNGRAATLTGPIEGWHTGEKAAGVWVRVLQGDVVASGHSSEGEFGSADKEWKVKATAPMGKKLAPGPAQAEYWAVIRMEDHKTKEQRWAVWPIELE
jgi:hypothetical protein